MANTVTMPVTHVEFVSGSRVRVTAEFPLATAGGWMKIQYYMPLSAQPKVGDTVTVTLG